MYFCTVNVDSRAMIFTLSSSYWQQASMLSALQRFEFIWKDWDKCSYQYNITIINQKGSEQVHATWVKHTVQPCQTRKDLNTFTQHGSYQYITLRADLYTCTQTKRQKSQWTTAWLSQGWARLSGHCDHDRLDPRSTTLGCRTKGGHEAVIGWIDW